MQSRKKFIESVGASCSNWNWSWSFVNHEKKFVIFGLWNIHPDGLILDEQWIGPSKKQSLEHVRLVDEQGYKLKIFPMEFSRTDEGIPKIKGFDQILIDKVLFKASGRWYARSKNASYQASIAEEVLQPEMYIEGATAIISVNAYERNAKARKACIKYYGYECFTCGFNFEDFYGVIGKDYIHVHHEVPLAKIRKEYIVDPIKDLKPLCPNCHAVIHKLHPPMPINDLIKLLKND
jgi:5-methylcytosine-specific restriction enzyme A